MSVGTIRKVKEEWKMAHQPVKVVIRCRPFNKKEIRMHGKEAGIMLDEKHGTVIALDPKNKDFHQTYSFDRVYGPESAQDDVYVGCCKSVTDSVLDGFNGSIIAYGQTGTGKTYTMEGDLKSKEQQGMMCRAVQHIFSRINCETSRSFQVNLSYIEIYQDTLRDLLNISGKKLKMHETDSGVYVEGLSNVTCRNFHEVLTWYYHGKVNRKTRSTSMSNASSRSHTILMLTVTSYDGAKTVKSGMLNLVDLAGSESQRKAGTKGEALKEGSKMNTSLSTLGKVVSLISSGSRRHIPYRDCKLTRILQESLGGNCLTTILATVGPCVYDFDETLRTLRFSSSARNMKKVVNANFSPRCGEGALVKDKIRALSPEEFKAVQVQELREKLRLISHRLAVHPNDLALQEMTNSCKSRIKQILCIHEDENDIICKKEMWVMVRDADKNAEFSRKQTQQLLHKESVIRQLMESVNSFQEFSSVMATLRSQIQGLKQIIEREDGHSLANISLSGTNALTQTEGISWYLKESALFIHHDVSTGIQNFETQEIDDIFLRDQPLKFEDCQLTNIAVEDKIQQTSEAVSSLSIRNSTQLMVSNNPKVLKDVLQGLHQQVLELLLETKIILRITNQKLKKVRKQRRLSFL